MVLFVLGSYLLSMQLSFFLGEMCKQTCAICCHNAGLHLRLADGGIKLPDGVGGAIPLRR